jgi:hypothetical protein
MDISMNSLTVHQLLLTAYAARCVASIGAHWIACMRSVMISAKVHDDMFLNNAAYAATGGVPLKQLNIMEVRTTHARAMCHVLVWFRLRCFNCSTGMLVFPLTATALSLTRSARIVAFITDAPV